MDSFLERSLFCLVFSLAIVGILLGLGLFPKSYTKDTCRIDEQEIKLCSNVCLYSLEKSNDNKRDMNMIIPLHQTCIYRCFGDKSEFSIDNIEVNRR